MNIRPLIFALITLSACVDSNSTELSFQIFPFIFSESTGDNLFVLSEGALQPVRSFDPKSNKKALLAFNSLKSNILYPNSEGTKIFLTGSYDKSHSCFCLTSWYLVAPFFSRDLINEAELPQNFKLTLRNELFQADFSNKLKNPAIFVLDTTKSISHLMKLQKE